jgi:hypothetical protein
MPAWQLQQQLQEPQRMQQHGSGSGSLCPSSCRCSTQRSCQCWTSTAVAGGKPGRIMFYTLHNLKAVGAKGSRALPVAQWSSTSSRSWQHHSPSPACVPVCCLWWPCRHPP